MPLYEFLKAVNHRTGSQRVPEWARHPNRGAGFLKTLDARVHGRLDLTPAAARSM
jgi:hypothetical protein